MLRQTIASRLLLLSLVMSSSSAFAAYHWQGSYVGAYFGGAFGSTHASTNVGNVSDSSYFLTAADINAVNNAGNSRGNPNSVIAGLQAGHDWQWRDNIIGVIVDYGALPLNSSKRVVNKTYPSGTDQYSVYTAMNTNWLVTLRGRLGREIIVHQWPSLLYFTGGLAVTQLKVNNNFADNSALSGAGGNSTSQNQIGWTLGAGIELVSFEHASITAEYLYVKVPSVKSASTISNSAGGFGIPLQSMNSPFDTTGSFHASLFKLGLNYRFND